MHRSCVAAAMLVLLLPALLVRIVKAHACPGGAVALLYNNGTGYAVRCYLYLQGRYSYEERQERSETSRTDFGNYYKDWKQRQPTVRTVDSGSAVDCSGNVFDEYKYSYCNIGGCTGDTLTGMQRDKLSSCSAYRFYAFVGNVYAWTFGDVSNLNTFVQLVRSTNQSSEVILNYGEFTSFDRSYWSTDTIRIQGITRLGDNPSESSLMPPPPPARSPPPPLLLPPPRPISPSSPPPPRPLPPPPQPASSPSPPSPPPPPPPAPASRPPPPSPTPSAERPQLASQPPLHRPPQQPATRRPSPRPARTARRQSPPVHRPPPAPRPN
ncbi:hypothetical protein HYH02_012129 [Chlamydomonas schloesseri]|uniref:Uncharacterized protein n=1 Tax=Chlamydomonas schloesseri TaxID=2026947 RepID=A0A835TB56_9CHLO|nr:hypothetical protein HYH02_012129 [Chlamydomonas schloesseri]|eukprot:KAG2434931.1 hypothetical protein HYH02_012129 [Chlamydomonas schloesseri]